MFSTDVVSTNSHHLRSKRSRRQGSEESVKLPQAKKRRAALRKDTFVPPSDVSSINDSSVGEQSTVQVRDHALEDKPATNTASLRSTELTLRGGKKSDKRSERSDGPLILSSNDYYTVAQLPALPEQIRSHSSSTDTIDGLEDFGLTHQLAPYSSVISPEYGYALALTHAHALIWPFNSTSSAPPTKDTFTFTLPFSIPSTEPLPIAAFTAKSASKEPGLVVITPSKGRIAYWETISSATSLVPSPQSHGVQGSVPGMFSSETITSIVNAEPAGFILTFSHGRVAHLTLKDQLGRPSIGVQFLRKIPSSSQSSLFGSIRNVFGGSNRKNIAAAHAGRASRGQRDVMITTGDGDVEMWDTRLSVGNSLKYQLNIKEGLLESLRHHLPAEESPSYHFNLLDFVFSTKSSNGQEVAKTTDDSADEVIFLVSLTNSGRSNYYLIESETSADAVNVKIVHPITCYRKPVNLDTTWQPKLVLPKPGQTAFIVFEKAIVLYSLINLQDSPSSQLLLEGGSLPESFQDSIRFQEDTPFQVLSCGVEDQTEDRKHPSIITAVQSFGLVRVTAISEATPDEIEEIKVTPKSKIEQAVFFGNIKNNPLDLVSRDEQQFAPEDIEAAALEISEEILTSKSKYLPKATPSIEQNLRSRAKAHDDLALHLSKYYNPLSRPARFQLLWGAQKLAAQRAIWKLEEEHRKHHPEGQETILQHILFYLHPDHKTQIDASKGENDRVRHWLTFDANKVEHIIPLLQRIHPALYEDEEATEPKVVAENMLESVEHLLAIYDTAFKVCEDSASLYGLGDETFSEGMLTAGYAGLPEPWTCYYYSYVVQLVNSCSEFVRKWWVNDSQTGSEVPSPATVRKIGASLPRLTEIVARILLERAKWCKAQESEKLRRQGESHYLSYRENSREQMLVMAGLGYSNEAIALAEKFRDMDMLVELNIDVVVELSEQSASQTNPKEAERLLNEAEKVNDRMDGYFEKFKDKWAKAYYERLIQDGQLGSLIGDEKNQDYLTRFLRKNPAYGKISWINDIIGEKSFSHAAETLASVAETQETDLWSKKVELSLSKLATLAAVEAEAKATKSKPFPSDEQAVHISTMTSSISLLDLQSRLHLHVTSLIGRNVLDIASKHDIAFDILGKNSPAVKDRPAFKGLLYDGLGALIRQESMTVEQLIDVLTLMLPIGSDESQKDKITDETVDAGVLGNEFFFPLKAIDFALPQNNDSDDNSALEKKSKREALQTIVWRRVMISDNWEELNNTASKSEQDVMDAMKNTYLWTTASQIFEEDIANSTSRNQSQAPSETYLTTPIPSPSSILSTELFPPVLQSRFSAQELGLVSKDFEAEEKRLQQEIEKGRLDVWFPGVLKAVKAEVFDLDEVAADEAVANDQANADPTDETMVETEDVQMKEVDDKSYEKETSPTEQDGGETSRKRRSVRFASD